MSEDAHENQWRKVPEKPVQRAPMRRPVKMAIIGTVLGILVFGGLAVAGVFFRA